MKKINIKSCFVSPFGIRDGDYLSITMEAVRPALDATDISRVTHVYLASYAPVELCGIADPLACVRDEIRAIYPGLDAAFRGLFKTGGEALFRALNDMSQTDRANDGDVLVVGSEKMTHLRPAVAAGFLAARDNGHEWKYGATLPALGALVTRMYIREYEVPEDAIHKVAVKNHNHGCRNPKAHFRKEITVEQVAESPLVADPLRRLHCAPVSDGAAAVILSHDVGSVACTGWGKGSDAPLFEERRELGRFPATARASADALSQAGLSHGDIDIVEIHDAFSSFELINLEEMGFYPLGHSWQALNRGELTINGTIAVNPSGGMKAKGHPIGTTGLSSCAELCAQLTGTAGARQHQAAQKGMIQSAGGVSPDSYVFVLEAV